MIKLKKSNGYWCVFVDWFDDNKTLMFSHTDMKKAVEYSLKAKKLYEEANQVSERLYKKVMEKKKK
jgi:hypothetical protein